MKPETRFNFF